MAKASEDMEWKRGWPPCDPRAERDWMDRWEVYWSPGGFIWHRRKPASANQ